MGKKDTSDDNLCVVIPALIDGVQGLLHVLTKHETVQKVVRIDDAFASLYDMWLHESEKSYSDVSIADLPKQKHQKRNDEEAAEGGVDGALPTVSALNGAADKFIHKVLHHHFFERVKRADGATRDIFDFM